MSAASALLLGSSALAGGTASYSLVSGNASFSYKGASESVDGYSTADGLLGAKGSIDNHTYAGYEILGIEWDDVSTKTSFRIYGDLHTLLPTMEVAGADQGLGAGSFYSVSPTTVSISAGSPGIVSWASHGRTTGERVFFRTTGALPAGLSPERVYFITVINANSFSLSETSGGPSVNTGAGQSGTHTAYATPYTTWQSAAPVTDPFVGTVAVDITT